MRRSLAKTVADDALIVEGRPSSPYRYRIHPVLEALVEIAATEKANAELRKEAKGLK